MNIISRRLLSHGPALYRPIQRKIFTPSFKQHPAQPSSNQRIVAGVVGTCLLGYAFIQSHFSSAKAQTEEVSPTPKFHATDAFQKLSMTEKQAYADKKAAELKDMLLGASHHSVLCKQLEQTSEEFEMHRNYTFNDPWGQIDTTIIEAALADREVSEKSPTFAIDLLITQASLSVKAKRLNLNPLHIIVIYDYFTQKHGKTGTLEGFINANPELLIQKDILGQTPAVAAIRRSYNPAVMRFLFDQQVTRFGLTYDERLEFLRAAEHLKHSGISDTVNMGEQMYKFIDACPLKPTRSSC